MPTISWPDKKAANPQQPITPPLLLECWGNKLVNQLHCGDNLQWLQYLQQAGTKTDLVYLDPPFCSQANYIQHFDLVSGRHSVPAFTDVLAEDDFLQFIFERIHIIHSILADTGPIFLHCDHQQSHHIRMILEDIFGREQFRNEIIWHYTGGGRSKRYFSRKHDSIFWFSKSSKWTFNADTIRVPYKKSSGFAKGGIRSKSGKVYKPNPLGTIPDDTWDIPMLNPLAKERTGYPTQKPQSLLDRIVLAASNPNDLVLDPFMGSGTTAVSCAIHGRRFMGADLNWNAIHCTQQRLLELNDNLKVTYSRTIPNTIHHITVDNKGHIQLAIDANGNPIQTQQVRYKNNNEEWTYQWSGEVKCIRAIALNGSFTDFEFIESMQQWNPKTI